jgi:hypothetical protein
VLENGSFCPLWVDYDYKEGTQGSVEHWKQRRSVTRLLQRTTLHDPEFVVRRDSAQGKLVSLAARRAGPAEDAGVSDEIGRIVKEFEE